MSKKTSINPDPLKEKVRIRINNMKKACIASESVYYHRIQTVFLFLDFFILCVKNCNLIYPPLLGQKNYKNK
jgi:hypothetical protein